MKIAIDDNFIESLKNSRGGLLRVDLRETKHVYSLLSDNSCRVLLMDKMCFILFKELENIEFAVEDYKKEKDLDFITKSDLEIIDVSKKDGNYFLFLLAEFFQGPSFRSRESRFISILIPLIALNVIGFYYADRNSINDVFSGLLTAISIFIAIFSLFVTSHDYLTRKKLSLFEKGQLSYYFAIDKYVTQTGIAAIVLSILGLIATSSSADGRLYEWDIHNGIVVLLLNVVFVAVYIILRSMIEFYIVRPGKFIMSDLKTESVKNYWKANNHHRK